MRAVTIADGALTVRKHPDPVAQRDEVLIAVHASGLNNADLAQIRGNYPAPAGSPATSRASNSPASSSRLALTSGDSPSETG